MYTIEVIKSDSYQTQKVSKGNFDRDSSFHFSRAGVIIHAASQRSTAFIPAGTELHSHFRYWIKQEQAAINGFIEAVVAGHSDEQSRENACQQSRKAWKFSKRKGHLGKGEIIAVSQAGGFETRHAGYSWEEIHCLTRP
jgi:hypothetical protein